MIKNIYLFKLFFAVALFLCGLQQGFGQATCTANAGTLAANQATVEFVDSSATISGTANGAVIPDGYGQLFLLSFGAEKGILGADQQPSFEIPAAFPGVYNIHSFVFQGDFDLNAISVVSTIDSVAMLLATLPACTSLDVQGTSFTLTPAAQVCTAVAGTVTATQAAVEFVDTSATISGTANGAVIPDGYGQLFLLSIGAEKGIIGADQQPSFEIPAAFPDVYNIHSFVFQGDFNLNAISVVSTIDSVAMLLATLPACTSLDIQGTAFTLTAGAGAGVTNSCAADADADGICDDVDPCVGDLDAVGVCNGGCTEDANQNGICDTEEVPTCAADADADGICDDVDPCVGTLDAIGVCNGGCAADANQNGICDTEEVPTCAADVDADGICDDVDDCVGTLDAVGVCNGGCAADANQNGICDTEEVPTCAADVDADGICDDVDDCVGTLDAVGVCNGGCTADANQNGICDTEESPTCVADTDGDGICDDVDPCVGFPDAVGVCNGSCTADTNLNGICDTDEVPVCKVDTDADGICDDVDPCVGALDAIGVCNGGCAADANQNGICDTEEQSNSCEVNIVASDRSITISGMTGPNVYYSIHNLSSYSLVDFCLTHEDCGESVTFDELESGRYLITVITFSEQGKLICNVKQRVEIKAATTLCRDVGIKLDGNKLTISNLNAAFENVVIYDIKQNSYFRWSIAGCYFYCPNNFSTILPAGEYRIKIQMYNNQFHNICNIDENIVIESHLDEGGSNHDSISNISQNSTNSFSSVTIFPNPATITIKIVLAGYKGRTAISLYNNVMQEVFHQEIDATDNRQLEIPTTNLKGGIYYAKIITEDNQQITKKVLVVK